MEEQVITTTNILLCLYVSIGIGSGITLSSMLIEAAAGMEPIESGMGRVIFAVLLVVLILAGIAVCGFTGPMLLSMLITEKLFEES